jgi:hypothetical protein
LVFPSTPEAFTPAILVRVVSRPTDPDADADAEPTVVGVDSNRGLELGPGVAADLRRLRDLSYLLDDSIRIPGTRFRIGVEPVVGLLPVVGDAFGVAVAVYALVVAARTGVPRATLARVAVVYWVDAVGGSVPILGDLFDAYWKANRRTVALLDARLDDPASAAADRRYLRRAALVGVCLGVTTLAGLAGLAWWLAGAL